MPVEHIGVGCGSVGLLQQIALAFAGPGTEVLYPWPSFIAYPQFTMLAGATEVAVPLRRCTFDVDAILRAVTPRTRVVMIANPNNPTSTGLRSGDLTRLVDGLPADVLCVIDEAYREFVTGADMPDAMVHFASRPNVAVLRTFSKAYAMAGLRVGYVVAAPSVITAIDATLTPFSVNAAGQAAALVAMQHTEEVGRRCAVIVAERERVESELRARGLAVPASQANFVWLPVGGGHSGDLVVAMEKRGVVTRPLPAGIRVTIGLPVENDQFLAAICGALDEVPAAFGAWTLPTGELATRGGQWITRLDAALERLRSHLDRPHSGLTRSVPNEDEQWDVGQVWAHLSEFGDYWFEELLAAFAGWDGTNAVPFGRTRRDPDRIAAIEKRRRGDPNELFDTAARSADRLRALLAEMSPVDWAAVGSHSTLGQMTVEQQLQDFHVGHYEQHADQLDEIS